TGLAIDAPGVLANDSLFWFAMLSAAGAPATGATTNDAVNTDPTNYKLVPWPPGDYTLTASLLTGPTHGTLSLNSDRSFKYPPDQDFNGSDPFTYHATATAKGATGDGTAGAGSGIANVASGPLRACFPIPQFPPDPNHPIYDCPPGPPDDNATVTILV